MRCDVLRKGINLFKVVLGGLIAIFVLMSFFDCVECVEYGSVDELAFEHKTNRYYDNVCWVVLILSVVQVGLLKFKNRLLRDIRETVALISALVTTVYPIYLLYKYPGFFGCSLGYVWTTIGYVVLILSWIIFLYNILVLRIIEKKQQSV